MKLVLCYLGMLAFDFGVIAGTIYLIDERNWSPWWIAISIVITLGSNPQNILKSESK